jgi:uncharacterized protein YdeI (YjbR/CyaY-like superfamily)
VVVPTFMAKALKQNPRALSTFEDFSQSHRKEYVDWVTEAKSEETRQKRLTTALSWMANGKSRNWKYMN